MIFLTCYVFGALRFPDLLSNINLFFRSYYEQQTTALSCFLQKTTVPMLFLFSYEPFILVRHFPKETLFKRKAEKLKSEKVVRTFYLQTMSVYRYFLIVYNREIHRIILIAIFLVTASRQVINHSDFQSYLSIMSSLFIYLFSLPAISVQFSSAK